MPAGFRGLVIPIMLVAAAAGCTRYGVSGPEDLGLASRFDPQINLATMTTTLDPKRTDTEIERNEILNRWLIRSDYLCADYQLQLSRSIRDTRLATDFLATVLAGLATIFCTAGGNSSLGRSGNDRVGGRRRHSIRPLLAAGRRCRRNGDTGSSHARPDRTAEKIYCQIRELHSGTRSRRRTTIRSRDLQLERGTK
jgi:hypothetical protein